MALRFVIKLAVVWLFLVDWVNAAFHVSDVELNDVHSVQVQKYLQQFEQFLAKQSGMDKSSMETVELLVLQSWMYSLSPTDRHLEGISAVNQLAKGRPRHESVIELIKAKSQATVADDVLHYTQSGGPFDQPRDILQGKSDELKDKIDNAGDTATDDLEDELEEADSILGVHDVALSMAAQSYLLNFVAKPSPGKFTMKSSDGTKKREFTVGTVEEGDFFTIADSSWVQ